MGQPICNKYGTTEAIKFGNIGEEGFYLLFKKNKDIPDTHYEWLKNDDTVNRENYFGTDLKYYSTNFDCWLNYDVKWWNSIKICGTVDIEYQKFILPNLKLDNWKDWDKYPDSTKQILGPILNPRTIEGVQYFCNWGVFDKNYTAHFIIYGDPSNYKFYNIPIDRLKRFINQFKPFPIFIKPTQDDNGEWSVSYFYDIPLEELKQAGTILQEIILPEEIINKINKNERGGFQNNQGDF